LSKSLSSGEGSGGATCRGTGLSSTSSLDTTSNTGLVADGGTDRLGGGSSRSHVGVDVGEDVDTAVLVDQVNIASGSHTLDRHLLKLVDNILERTASSEGAVGSNYAGHRAVSSVDDGLVVELINLGVEGNSSSLLELNVVLDAGSSVEEVGDHRSVGHPVGDGSGEVVGSRCLAILDTSTKTSRIVGGTLLLLLLVAVLRSLLLLLLVASLGLATLVSCLLASRSSGSVAVNAVTTLDLGERSSVSRRGKERGDKNVLHFDCEIGSVEWNKIMSKDMKESKKC
jgi:hypothetical protein